MPEPNLPPLRLTTEASKSKNIISINSIKEILPELPEKTRQVLLENHNLAIIHAINLVVSILSPDIPTKKLTC
jgi:aspartyl-tRNA(Asn)/glutamyl-tRNA(Gln) amidotransferase subunit B